MNSAQGSYLTIKAVNPEIIEAIQTAEVSPEFVDALAQSFLGLAEAVVPNGESLAVVEVPRGGTFPAQVLFNHLGSNNPENAVQYMIANMGGNKIEGLPVIADDIPIVDHYLIPDGIMATGSTAKQIIQAISDKCAEVDVVPRFTIMTPLVSGVGLSKENNFLDWIAETGLDVSVLSAKVVEEGEYVQFGDKPVLVVGSVVRGQDGQIQCGIGDFGDMLTGANEQGMLLDWFSQRDNN